jgi:valine dehydrogenase (NAD+)
VFQGLRAAAATRWGGPSLEGRTVGISGVGKVGRNLVPLLVEAGAAVVVTDVDPAAVAAIRQRFPQVRAVPDNAALLAEPLDAWSPCALGGAITPEVAATISAAIVCGGANNQLATPQAADVLAARDVLYCPDFCVNSGGVIQVADEVHGFSFDRAKARTARIYETTLDVLADSRRLDVTPVTAAMRRAERRMTEIGGLARILRP